MVGAGYSGSKRKGGIEKRLAPASRGGAGGSHDLFDIGKQRPLPCPLQQADDVCLRGHEQGEEGGGGNGRYHAIILNIKGFIIKE
jgi:hypothetical protein